MSRRRFLSMLVCLTMSLSLMACGKTDVVATKDSAESSVAVEIEIPEPTAEDMKKLEVTEEYAKTNGRYAVYLLRDNKLYSLSWHVPADKPSKYNIGYVSDYTYSTIYKDGLSIGDVPLPVLTEGDKVIVFDDENVELRIWAEELVCYDIRAMDVDDGIKVFLDGDDEPILISNRYKHSFKVEDNEGNEIQKDLPSATRYNYNGLKLGETYNVSWEDEDGHHDGKMTADCYRYDALLWDERQYILNGTSDGECIVYDVDIAPGTYSMRRGDNAMGGGYFRVE